MITSPPLYEIGKDNQLIISKLNEIRFNKDFHPKLKGYMVEKEGGIWIFHIEAKEIGKGHFSRLINKLKQKYDFIIIPTPSNMMRERAIHLGFVLNNKWFGEPYNEYGFMLEWYAKSENEVTEND